MGIGGPFPGGKARPGRDADHSPLYRGREWVGAILSPQAPPWRVAGLLYFFTYMYSRVYVWSTVGYIFIYNFLLLTSWKQLARLTEVSLYHNGHSFSRNLNPATATRFTTWVTRANILISDLWLKRLLIARPERCTQRRFTALYCGIRFHLKPHTFSRAALPRLWPSPVIKHVLTKSIIKHLRTSHSPIP
jgi:hypothetical protein